MSKPYVFYIGDAFKATLIYKADGINPTPITIDINIAASIKDSFGNRVDLVVIVAPDQVNNTGIFSVISKGTTHLKPGKAAMDIKYTIFGIHEHTSKFYFSIERGITP